MNIKAQIQQAAVKFFLGILHSSAGDQAPFKALITVEIDGELKPLLLVGTAHSRVEDGSCIAVLNPDRELVGILSGSYGGNATVFREVVAKRCDLAMTLWIEAYKDNRVIVGARYRNKTPSPAKFSVREFAR
jgi:hypothetical protein